MSVSLSEAVERLVNGVALSWDGSGDHKSGKIKLAEPAQRRLFKHLTEADAQLVAEGAESLFEGLILAWKSEDEDPAENLTTATTDKASGPWRLHRIEAFGFGGLNTYKGPVFDLNVGGENWCLEGYNGSGKTALSSAIMWAMTGFRVRQQDGPVREMGKREPVLNSEGQTSGTWPPLVSYPSTAEELSEEASAWARLTFYDPSGDVAIAFRKIVSPIDVDSTMEVTVDPRLLTAPQLIEAGLLMPARITHIGFGGKSQSLYDALKMLTGFDHLADIASGASVLCHKGRKFLKYAKDNGADGHEKDFTHNLALAREQAKESPVDLTKPFALGDEELNVNLTTLANSASEKAGEFLDLLKSDIAPIIDISTSNGRQRLNRAVSSARHLVEQKTKGVEVFTAWSVLKQAAEQESFAGLPKAIIDTEQKLGTALIWHGRQGKDQKLRLKALASKFYVDVSDLELVSTCPLCETKLTSDEQSKLAAELAELKEHASIAERTIDDACADLEKALRLHLPQELQRHFDLLAEMDPTGAYGEAVLSRFSTGAPFGDVLQGIATAVQKTVSLQVAGLPACNFEGEDESDPDEPAAAIRLRKLVGDARRVFALSEWWSVNRDAFRTAWADLLGQVDEDGNWPTSSLEGMLERLEQAIEKSEPLDKISTHLKKAVTAAEEWDKINQQQKVREEIAAALEPLKDLRMLVDCETHRAIETLSGRVATILENIRLKDRLTFENTALAKKAVNVQGSFTPGLKIDAALVANTSWLRALLWAFIFALREQTIEDQGTNPFPLMVLDDPQLTFDPKNKRQWAETIVELANCDPANAVGMHLLAWTHERQFYEILCETEKLDGQKGKIVGPTKSSAVAHIVNGTFLERQYDKRFRNNLKKKDIATCRMSVSFARTCLKSYSALKLTRSPATRLANSAS